MSLIEISSQLKGLNWELIIAAIAVLISAYSAFASRASSKKINEQQLQINEILLAKEKKIIDEEKKAEFRVFKTGSKGNYNLVVTNQGKADAKKVRLEILIDPKYKSCFWNIDSIFPIDISSGCSATTKYSRGLDFPEKFRVKVIWDDEYTNGNNKEIEIVT